LSLLLYVSSNEVQARQLVRNEKGRNEERDVPERFAWNEATVINLDVREFYAEIPVVEELMPDSMGVENVVVILRTRGREYLSSTGLLWLRCYAQEYRQSGNPLMMADVLPRVLEDLQRTGIMDVIGRDNVYPAGPGCGASTDKALTAAQSWLAVREVSPVDGQESTDDSPVSRGAGG
jgi:SulP family sulfate permease